MNDTLYAKAEVPPTEEVYIWLGANVMLAYPMDEAEALLAERASKAKQSLEDCEEDLEFLREQITVSWLPGPFLSVFQGLSFGLAPIMSGRNMLTYTRLWRLRQQECTTGMLYRSEKTEAKRMAKTRSQPSLVAEAIINLGNR